VDNCGSFGIGIEGGTVALMGDLRCRACIVDGLIGAPCEEENVARLE
jgi:hypothetical protein